MKREKIFSIEKASNHSPECALCMQELINYHKRYDLEIRQAARIGKGNIGLRVAKGSYDPAIFWLCRRHAIEAARDILTKLDG